MEPGELKVWSRERTQAVDIRVSLVGKGAQLLYHVYGNVYVHVSGVLWVVSVTLGHPGPPGWVLVEARASSATAVACSVRRGTWPATRTVRTGLGPCWTATTFSLPGALSGTATVARHVLSGLAPAYVRYVHTHIHDTVHTHTVNTSECTDRYVYIYTYRKYTRICIYM